MRKGTCSMGVAFDGCIAGPDGGFSWSEPDEELFRCARQEVRGLGVHLLGRRLYESMSYWLRVHPVLVGGGTPFFPREERREDLELLGSRTFSSGVAHLHYRVRR